MKKWLFLFLSGITIILYSSCNNDGGKDTGSNTTTTATSANKANDGNTATGDKEDSRINNAGAAKKPKGKMSYMVDGKPITLDENTVQCMYIGMNSTMAQSVISGGNQCMIMHMGIPKVGNVEIESIATMPSVGVQVTIDGVQYNNKKPGDAKFALTKVTPDGKNYYVAGTFSGKLTSTDGTKTITLTNGVFESAYL